MALVMTFDTDNEITTQANQLKWLELRKYRGSYEL